MLLFNFVQIIECEDENFDKTIEVIYMHWYNMIIQFFLMLLFHSYICK